MQQRLAQRLLSATLNWSDEQIEKYRELLEDFSELKYDQYQQYHPGSRFIENLCIWLNQFEESERALALEFVLNNLIFISPAEMQHLISMVYPEVVAPIVKDGAQDLLRNCSAFCGKPLELAERVIKRQSLFLALSDGARIDFFRRSSKLEHAQVYVNYDVPKTKFKELLSEMQENIGAIVEHDPSILEQLPKKFQSIFLLDDFSGSGISYIRKENGEWKGKIPSLLKSLSDNGLISDDADAYATNPKIHIVLYLITSQAEEAIKKNLEEYCKGKSYVICIHYIQKIQKVSLSAEEEGWLKKYYNSSVVEDSHYRKGNMDAPHHGFDGCNLALVLYHNTPNNSFPILWAGDRALFPRVTRHRDVKD